MNAPTIPTPTPDYRLLLARMADHDLPPRIPLGGEQGNVGGDKGADTFTGENEFEGSERAVSGAAAVKIEVGSYHKP